MAEVALGGLQGGAPTSLAGNDGSRLSGSLDITLGFGTAHAGLPMTCDGQEYKGSVPCTHSEPTPIGHFSPRPSRGLAGGGLLCSLILSQLLLLQNPVFLLSLQMNPPKTLCSKPSACSFPSQTLFPGNLKAVDMGSVVRSGL